MRSRRVLRRRCGLLAAAVVAIVVAVRHAGAWLIVDDALQPAASITVLGGGTPFRALEAADLHRGGWAPAIWLTRGADTDEERALDRLGVERTAEYEISERVLLASGVPAAAVVTLPGANDNTADEVRAVARELARTGGRRAIIVTSKSHTRRVRVLWNRLVAPAFELVIRPASRDPFDASWWRSTRDAMAVAREWAGIVNTLLGFPLSAAESRAQTAGVSRGPGGRQP